MQLVCPLMIFLLFIPEYPIIYFSTLYTKLPHKLIKEKLLDIIERAFKKIKKKMKVSFLACNNKKAFFTSTDHRGYKLWSCQNVYDALSYRLDKIYIRLGNKLYKLLVF